MAGDEFTSGGKTYSRGLWTDAVELDKRDTRAKSPTYEHAKREAEKHGDDDTYFMRRTPKKAMRKRVARKRG